MPKRVIFFLCLPVVFYLISCSKDTQAPAPPAPPKDTTVHVTGLTIDPTQFILVPTMTRQLTAAVTPSNAANKDVSWNTSDNTIATVDIYGVVKAVRVGTVTITASSKDRPSVKATTKLTVLRNYDVYAVGNAADHSAVMWKNGVSSSLPGGYLAGTDAYAITLDGDDIYIAGNTINSSFWGIPTYWKNGIPHIVDNNIPNYYYYTRAIAVNSGKVYFTGYGFNSTECPAYCYGRFRAFYWVDDGGTISQTPLVDSISSTTAYGIAINGDNVIVAGARANDNFYRWSIGWKNDVDHGTILSPVDGYYEAMAVTVHGGDNYFVGYGGCANYGCNATAYVWKNDMSHTIPLTNGSTDAQATCMSFTGDTLYVGGYQRNAAGKKIATYWRVVGNQVSSPRSLSDGANDCTVNGIAAIGNDIFLVGMSVPSAGGGSAAGWRTYEGGLTPMFVDVTSYYLPYGYAAWGIYVR
jgi:hypothetical protein